MSNLGKILFCIIGYVFISYFALSTAKASSKELSSHQPAKLRHSGVESDNLYLTSVHPAKSNTKPNATLKFNSRAQRRAHFRNGHARGGNLTRVIIDVTGPNVCGSRCCRGWTVTPGSRRCTKPRCLPQCSNRAVCREPNICECRKGFHGRRCVRASFAKASATLHRVHHHHPNTSSSATSHSPATSPSPATSTSPVINVTAATTPSRNLSPATSISATSLPPAVSYSPAASVAPATTPTPATALPPAAGATPVPTGAAQNTSAGSDQTKHHARVEAHRTQALRWKSSSEQQQLQKALVSSVGGSKVPSVLLDLIEAERRTLQTSPPPPTSLYSSTKTFHTQRGQYTLIYSAVLCTIMCKNGGVCIGKDKCHCPPNFTGKFCHIPAPTSSTNEIEKPRPSPSASANRPQLVQSEYILPLQSPQQSRTNGSPMVRVRVQHPPEAGVQIHQVLKVGYGPSQHQNSETVTWATGSSGARSRTPPGQQAEEAPPPRIQAQTIRGGGAYTERSGFKYCFREVSDGHCSSPLPGLRTQETCCNGLGRAWGINECTLCPSASGTHASGEGSCPRGFERVNGTQCVDVNECVRRGVCDNGNCVNTRGSYSCICRPEYLLDVSRGICISQKVISEVKGQCFRVVSQGACSLPILRNITKQICCCSRVGKAWGANCQSCPYFGTVAFKEICPAGPGYHYSASAVKLNQRLLDQLGTGKPPVVSQSASTSGDQAAANSQGARDQSSAGAQPTADHTNAQTTGLQSSLNNRLTGVQSPTRPQVTRIQSPSSAGSLSLPTRPQPESAGVRRTPASGALQPAGTVTAQPPRGLSPVVRAQTSRPPVNRQPISPIRPLPVPSTPRPLLPRAEPRFCDSQPQVCGAGSCVDLPGGKHTCVCNRGYQLNAQRTGCQDIDECVQRPFPCASGRCENTPGSYKCVCRTGYKLQGNTCIDIDECEDPLQCPGQECVNSQGSYRCVSCRPGFGLLNGRCSDIDECRQFPSPCSNGRCENTPGSYRCVCRPGYRLQGNICKDIDECEDHLQCPGQECVNSQGSYRCVSCRPGFGLLNGRCSDIDECRKNSTICGNGRCENALGSYRCVCGTGYRQQGSSCADIDECRQNALICGTGRCENTPGSYRCVCGTGYRLQGSTCTDIDECRQNSTICGNSRCENTLGSYRCVCGTGYRQQGSSCTDIDECRQNALICGTGRCENTPGSYRCVCGTGYRLQGSTCTDIDECRQNALICGTSRCENTPGSYRCVCGTGYRLQGSTCTDIDECEDPLQCPGQECVNSQGSYRCVSCRPGFGLLNGRCSDIDECRQNSGLCANGRCENTAGSYRCVCHPGFRQEGTTCTDVNECENGLQCPGKECVNSVGSYKCVSCTAGFQVREGQCQDIDECQQTPSPCSSGRCENTPGSYRCVCRPGYELQGNTCTDVDECKGAGVCAGQSVCVNTEGSFRCDCAVGYRAAEAGRQCRDINECLEGEFCFPRGECVNTEGSYRCVCAQGYTTSTNGTACVDVDECGRGGVCEDGRCVNTQGSFQCHCKTGFSANPEKTTCLDVDECVDSEGAICGSQLCENTIGSYRCVTSCDPGYSITATGECVDINECANETVCGDHAFCQNLIGTYQCICDQGYESTGDGRMCVDTNECVIMPGVCGSAPCENVEGSFMCVCPDEKQEFDPRMGRCVSSASAARPVSPVNASPSTGGGGASRGGVGRGSLAPAAPGEVRECYYKVAERGGACSVLGYNTSQQECCCTVGQAWGLHCQYQPCPQPGTVEYRALCPSGRGYVVTTTAATFSYKDVDECKLFETQVCKNGVCVNNIPGFSCYCSSGYHYNTVLLECIDTDECEAEDVCFGGNCVNTLGSYFCSCEPPLVLDDTQRNCVNSTGLAVDEHLSFCWQHVTADLVCQSPLLAGQVTFTDCCCVYGEGWGLECALCPAPDSEAYESLCNGLTPPVFSPLYPDRYEPEPEPGAGYRPPYRPSFPDPLPGQPEDYRPDYDDYLPGGRAGVRGRTPSSYGPPEPPYRLRPGVGSYYDPDQYGLVPGPPFPLPDPRGERAFGARPPLGIPEGRPLSLAPLPDNSPYSEDLEEEEEPWRAPPPFPPYPDRRAGGEVPRRVYERRYEPYAGLRAEDCGILQGCENGRCIRVAEGYTCDCYDGYHLDITTMTCTDVDECEDPDVADCVNGRCVNTPGSYHCVCLRGFVMSRPPNECVPG